MPDPGSVLDAPMVSGPLKDKTLRQAFFILMANLWAEDECFSGKRPSPFDSDWTCFFIEAVVAAGLVARSDEGEKAAVQMILKALNQEAQR